MKTEIIKPGDNKVIVSVSEVKEKTSGGIFIPELSKQHSQVGTVLAIGSNVTFCQVGDEVIYGNYLGIEMTYEDKPMVILFERELQALIVN